MKVAAGEGPVHTERVFVPFAGHRQPTLEETARQALRRVFHILFRRRALLSRLRLVGRVLADHGVAGKQVLDLGCGTGDTARLAAYMGARVTGLDGVGANVAAARRQSRAAGLHETTEFHVADVTASDLPDADVTLIAAVADDEADIAPFLERACRCTAEMLVVVHTRRSPWRRSILRLRATLRGAPWHHHAPEEVAAIVTRAGLAQVRRVRAGALWALTFTRGAERRAS